MALIYAIMAIRQDASSPYTLYTNLSMYIPIKNKIKRLSHLYMLMMAKLMMMMMMRSLMKHYIVEIIKRLNLTK